VIKKPGSRGTGGTGSGEMARHRCRWRTRDTIAQRSPGTNRNRSAIAERCMERKGGSTGPQVMDCWIQWRSHPAGQTGGTQPTWSGVV